jgi:two-component system cell cycle response regulator
MVENHHCACKAATLVPWRRSGQPGMLMGISSKRLMESPSASVRTPSQILVADDSPIFRDMLQKMLRAWNYEVIVVSDVRDRYVYMILLSVRAELTDVVEGMDSGADDYIVKPFQVEELHARLRAGQRVLALQDELVEAREALREQATRDALTGLWNRRAIYDILQNELARSSRTSEPLIVLMADLDGFKPVNDRFGHLVGDSVLRQVAARMRASVRRYDAVGRYGGEEFLIVLPGCGLPGGIIQAERIRDAIGAETFPAGHIDIALTCSLGAACAFPPPVQHADDLVREADAALYRAKYNGRNRVVAAALSEEAAVGVNDPSPGPERV